LQKEDDDDDDETERDDDEQLSLEANINNNDSVDATNITESSTNIKDVIASEENKKDIETDNLGLKKSPTNIIDNTNNKAVSLSDNVLVHSLPLKIGDDNKNSQPLYYLLRVILCEGKSLAIRDVGGKMIV
jgi:hypothetical protein